MELCNPSGWLFRRLAGWPLPIRPSIILCDKNFNDGRYAQTFLTKFFLICYAYRHYRLLPFHTTFSGLDLGCWSQCLWKAKPDGFIFSHFN